MLVLRRQISKHFLSSPVHEIFTKHLFDRELGIGIVAYSPLGLGFFAGKAVVESLPSESILVCVCKSNYYLYVSLSSS